MSIKIDSDRLLALLGENGERWIQGSWGDDEQTCLHGAIRRCQPQPGDAFLIEVVAADQNWGTSWNDDERTSWAMVRDRIIDGIEVTDEMLAETLGPQWFAIVALIRRAAQLTADEGWQLASAQNASWGLTRVNPRHKAYSIALDAARTVAWNAGRGAAQNAAQNAAGAATAMVLYDVYSISQRAALALAVRDLISEEGFTQQHYDLLTQPWATVVGPVHPDDTNNQDKE